MRISDNDSESYKRSRTYRNTATNVLCCSDDWISHVSHVLLPTDTSGEALWAKPNNKKDHIFVYVLHMYLLWPARATTKISLAAPRQPLGSVCRMGVPERGGGQKAVHCLN